MTIAVLFISQLFWKKTLCYPFLASREKRTAYTKTLNQELATYCRLRNIPFIDIYNHLVDTKNGLRKKDLIYDYSHLNNTTTDLVLQHHSFT